MNNINVTPRDPTFFAWYMFNYKGISYYKMSLEERNKIYTEYKLKFKKL